jgi:hypothetical protein
VELTEERARFHPVVARDDGTGQRYSFVIVDAGTAELVGFRREGVMRSRTLHRDGRRRDAVLFSLLSGELV